MRAAHSATRRASSLVEPAAEEGRGEGARDGQDARPCGRRPGGAGRPRARGRAGTPRAGCSLTRRAASVMPATSTSSRSAAAPMRTARALKKRATSVSTTAPQHGVLAPGEDPVDRGPAAAGVRGPRRRGWSWRPPGGRCTTGRRRRCAPGPGWRRRRRGAGASASAPALPHQLAARRTPTMRQYGSRCLIVNEPRPTAGRRLRRRLSASGPPPRPAARCGPASATWSGSARSQCPGDEMYDRIMRARKSAASWISTPAGSAVLVQVGHQEAADEADGPVATRRSAWARAPRARSRAPSGAPRARRARRRAKTRPRSSTSSSEAAPWTSS